MVYLLITYKVRVDWSLLEYLLVLEVEVELLGLDLLHLLPVLADLLLQHLDLLALLLVPVHDLLLVLLVDLVLLLQQRVLLRYLVDQLALLLSEQLQLIHLQRLRLPQVYSAPVHLLGQFLPICLQPYQLLREQQPLLLQLLLLLDGLLELVRITDIFLLQQLDAVDADRGEADATLLAPEGLARPALAVELGVVHCPRPLCPPVLLCFWLLDEVEEGVEHEDLIEEHILQGVILILSRQLIDFFLQLL